MQAQERHICTRCGRTLSDSSLGNRCPHCLLELALTPPPEEEADDPPMEVDDRPASERRFFGAYELIEEISRGGMGIVYRARQFQPDREVALKMIHPAGRATPSARLRFQVEVAAVARLNHPHIVSLYESGEKDGVVYYTMRLVRGPGLDEWVAEQHPSPDLRLRVEMLIRVAHAVHYAHQRGILHRDLKPSNILIEKNGQPCIDDFGLAKIQESDAGLTHDQAVLGSPAYMAPEQARGGGGEITMAADIYSLGAVLYELLTGVPPFRGNSPLATLRQVAETPPVPPCQINPNLPRDLESICLKALEKSPADRYSSALALAEDLERWRQGEPVKARALHPLIQFWRWCRRRPAWAALVGVVLFSLVTLALGSTLVARRLKMAADETRELVRRLQHEKAEHYLEDRETAKGIAMLAYLIRENPDDRVAGTRLMSILGQRPLAVPFVQPWISGNRVLAVGFCGDGRHSLAVAANGAFRRLDLESGETWNTDLCPDEDPLLSALFHPGRNRLITTHADGRVTIWNADEPVAPVAILPHPVPVKHLAVSVDGGRLITADKSNDVRIWMETEEPSLGSPSTRTGNPFEFFAVAVPSGDSVESVALDVEGALFAIGTESGRLIVRSAADPAFRVAEHQLPGSVQRVAFDRQGRRIAAATDENMAWLGSLTPLEQAAPRLLTMWLGPTDLQFSPDGRYLAAAGWSRVFEAYLWDTETGERVGTPIRHHNSVTGVRFRPDGRELVTFGYDNTVRRWSVGGWEPLCEPLVHLTAPLDAAFEPRGNRFVTGSYTGAVWWDLSPPPVSVVHLVHEQKVTRAAAAPKGNLTAVATREGRLALWDLKDRSIRREVQAHDDAVLFVGFSPSGDRLVTFDGSGTARLWGMPEFTPIGEPMHHPEPIYSAEFSPDDRRLLTACLDGQVRLVDIDSDGGATLTMDHGAPLFGARFSPDGTRVVSFGKNESIRIWNSRNGRLYLPPLELGGHGVTAAFRPDGLRVAAAGDTAKVRVWDANSGRFLGEPLQHQNRVVQVEYSPDGRWLASASRDATVQVIGAGIPEAEPSHIAHATAIRWIAFSPDSRWLLTLSEDETVRIWDPATGLPVTESIRQVAGYEGRAFFNADGSKVFMLGGDASVELWTLPRYESRMAARLATVAQLVGRMTMMSGNRFIVTPAENWGRWNYPLDLREWIQSAPPPSP